MIKYVFKTCKEKHSPDSLLSFFLLLRVMLHSWSSHIKHVRNLNLGHAYFQWSRNLQKILLKTENLLILMFTHSYTGVTLSLLSCHSQYAITKFLCCWLCILNSSLLFTNYSLTIRTIWIKTEKNQMIDMRTSAESYIITAAANTCSAACY